MQKLLYLISEITKDNKYISEYVDRNLESMKTSEMESMDKSNKAFYSFLIAYSEKNNAFKSEMAELGYKSVYDIPKNDFMSDEQLNVLKKDFEKSVTSTSEKIKMYSKLISGELNMINKIKNFKSNGKLDLRL